jgi:hypothetical protein
MTPAWRLKPAKFAAQPEASPCSAIAPDASIVDNTDVLRSMFMQSKKMKIMQKIDGTNDTVTSMYSFDFVDIGLSDSLLKTDIANNDKAPFHGKTKNIYVGIDIKNNEIDILFFRSGMGLDERLTASFKVQRSNGKCILATKYYNDEYRAQLTVDSPSSLRIE